MSDEEQINELHDEDHLAGCGRCRRLLIQEAQDLEKEVKELREQKELLSVLHDDALTRIILLNQKIEFLMSKV